MEDYQGQAKGHVCQVRRELYADGRSKEASGQAAPLADVGKISRWNRRDILKTAPNC